MSAFRFVDRVAEVKDGAVTAYFELRGDEEFLKDHFDGFPVMPGVLLLESLKQTALALLANEHSGNGAGIFYRFSEAENVKFGQFVRPGSLLRMTARLAGKDGATRRFEGRIDLLDKASGALQGKALSADFKLTPVS